jgi:hypothetical protein
MHLPFYLITGPFPLQITMVPDLVTQRLLAR